MAYMVEAAMRTTKHIKSPIVMLAYGALSEIVSREGVLTKALRLW